MLTLAARGRGRALAARSARRAWARCSPSCCACDEGGLRSAGMQSRRSRHRRETGSAHDGGGNISPRLLLIQAHTGSFDERLDAAEVSRHARTRQETAPSAPREGGSSAMVAARESSRRGVVSLRGRSHAREHDRTATLANKVGRERFSHDDAGRALYVGIGRARLVVHFSPLHRRAFSCTSSARSRCWWWLLCAHWVAVTPRGRAAEAARSRTGRAMAPAVTAMVATAMVAAAAARAEKTAACRRLTPAF